MNGKTREDQRRDDLESAPRLEPVDPHEPENEPELERETNRGRQVDPRVARHGVHAGHRRSRVCLFTTERVASELRPM
jgi:hypothetical protein